MIDCMFFLFRLVDYSRVLT